MISLSSRRRVPVEIGIAPLVDCVFLLLIFFLLS
jgi:biopolymer transport protein ExbD